MHRVDYNRDHLKRNRDRLLLRCRARPVPIQPVTDWPHFRAANVLGMAAETLPIQEDIEELAKKSCRALLLRTGRGRLIAGLELPAEGLPWVSTGAAVMFYVSRVDHVLIKNHLQGDDSRRLLSTVTRGGQRFQICRFSPRHDQRDPFPAKVLDDPPDGVDFPPNCGIVAEIFPSKVSKDAFGADAVLSDLVMSDGES